MLTAIVDAKLYMTFWGEQLVKININLHIIEDYAPKGLFARREGVPANRVAYV